MALHLPYLCSPATMPVPAECCHARCLQLCHAHACGMLPRQRLLHAAMPVPCQCLFLPDAAMPVPARLPQPLHGPIRPCIGHLGVSPLQLQSADLQSSSSNPCHSCSTLPSYTCWVYRWNSNCRTHTIQGCLKLQQTALLAIGLGRLPGSHPATRPAKATTTHLSACCSLQLNVLQPYHCVHACWQASRCLKATAVPCSCTRGSFSSSEHLTGLTGPISNNLVPANLCVAAAALRRTQPQPPLSSVSSCAALTSHGCCTLQVGCCTRQPVSRRLQHQRLSKLPVVA